VRSRAIERQLRRVEALPEHEAAAVIGIAAAFPAEDTGTPHQRPVEE
jgi:hypothetical protein